LKLLFVADPLESFKDHKDSTFAMMREAARRGHVLLACEPRQIRWQRGEPVTAQAREISLTGGARTGSIASRHRAWRCATWTRW
jgi:glutathione synthase